MGWLAPAEAAVHLRGIFSPRPFLEVLFGGAAPVRRALAEFDSQSSRTIWMSSKHAFFWLQGSRTVRRSQAVGQRGFSRSGEQLLELPHIESPACKTLIFCT